MATITTETGPTVSDGDPVGRCPDGDPVGGFADGDRVGVCLEAMTCELAGVVDVGAWSLSDADLRDRLGRAWRLRGGLDELIARLVGSVDSRGLAVDDGASSSQAWLAWTLRTSRGTAVGLLSRARAVSPRLEVTRRAWAAGAVGTEQAGLIARSVAGLCDDLDVSAWESAQALLVQQAAVLTYPEFRVFANRVVEVVDPDGADTRLGTLLQAQEARAWQLTRFSRRRRGDGTSDIAARLSDLHADLLTHVLDGLAAPRRAGAGRVGPPAGTGTSMVVEVDGDHSDSEIGPLTGGQRLGRALCELIEHLPPGGYTAGGSTTTSLVVTVDADRLTSRLGAATLDTGTQISIGQARRLACTADILPVVLGGQSRILDLGTSRRLFDRYQRLALTVRDHGCVWPGCDRPPGWCEAHHIDAWSHQGPTNLSNGCLLCSYHHHLLHQGEWAIRMAGDAIPDLIPPTRIDPHQQPIRHHRYTPMLN